MFFGYETSGGSFDNWFKVTISSMDTARGEYD